MRKGVIPGINKCPALWLASLDPQRCAGAHRYLAGLLTSPMSCHAVLCDAPPCAPGPLPLAAPAPQPSREMVPVHRAANPTLHLWDAACGGIAWSPPGQWQAWRLVAGAQRGVQSWHGQMHAPVTAKGHSVRTALEVVFTLSERLLRRGLHLPQKNAG